VAEGDPRLANERPIKLDERTSAGGLVLDVERANGSHLRALARRYDGMMGGAARAYLLVAVWFERTGLRFRSRGVALDRREAAEMREALDRWLASLDEGDVSHG
jgi:hypothetical protein